MPSNYTGVPGNAVSPPVISDPVDGDADNGSTFQAPLQTLADNVAAALLGLTGLIPGGRLTLTTGTPVTTSDVTGATTVYYTPYLHQQIPLYNGTSWQWFTFAEMSQLTTDATKSPAAVVASSNYDIFVWSDSGTLRATRGPAWTSDTSRGTGAGTSELQQINGRWTNKQAITNGPAANRGLYVGTIRADGSLHANDAQAFRHVWNYYNRIRRSILVNGNAASWTQANSTWRQANASAANQIDLVRGFDEDAVDLALYVFGDNSGASTTTPISMGAAIGLDSTTVPATNFRSSILGSQYTTLGNNVFGGIYVGTPGLGRHILTWIEAGGSTGTTTWAASLTVLAQTWPGGLSGSCWA